MSVLQLASSDAKAYARLNKQGNAPTAVGSLQGVSEDARGPKLKQWGIVRQAATVSITVATDWQRLESASDVEEMSSKPKGINEPTTPKSNRIDSSMDAIMTPIKSYEQGIQGPPTAPWMPNYYRSNYQPTLSI